MELTEQELEFQKVYIELRKINETFAQAILDKDQSAIEAASEKQEQTMADLLDPKFSDLHSKFNNDMKVLLEECKVIETHLNTLADEE
ncbi:hypothetical protein J1N51_14035 [Psychrosphaera ytuae]|uniref:Uncharacterized protein n=1 Tax=Psychrosphaera ytuae TaxID=2820710 RepID=A0A975HI36_9GAMM|nr:hypothetical protein [Psychrosphaera ytuae]QTH63810.1 hypothetical protein J1N51_14035 [Psychrosphaera ytuae]